MRILATLHVVGNFISLSPMDSRLLNIKKGSFYLLDFATLKEYHTWYDKLSLAKISWELQGY